jgi:hypothetical protein
VIRILSGVTTAKKPTQAGLLVTARTTIDTTPASDWGKSLKRRIPLEAVGLPTSCLLQREHHLGMH